MLIINIMHCKIEFMNNAQEESGIAELLAIRKDIHVVEKNYYIITKSECEHLKSRNIKHKIIEEF